jgi:peptidoglycan glycosyltransferase
VNKPITRLFTLILVLFGALVAYTSRWTVFDASALQANKLNVRSLLESADIPRGTIYAGNSIVAYSQRSRDGSYVRRYPFGSLFGQPIGYSIPIKASAGGLEAYRNRALSGTPLEHQSIIAQLEGHQAGGDSVYTTLDPAAQQVATSDLQKALRKGAIAGAVVAIVPSTGAVKVFAGLPTFNPNALVAGKPAGNQFDQAAEGEPGEPPGSAQKVVTAVAAIDSGRFTPTSVVNGNSPQSFQGIPLNNDGSTSYGPVSLTYALTNSINTAWANVAKDLGPALLQKYMLRFGYYRDPPIDLPAAELSPSGVRDPSTGRLVLPDNGIDYPLVGIGEGQLYVTPLQMAMVAAAVANHGVLMTPHITARIVNADGLVVQRVKPSVYSDVMKPSTAAAVTTMMEQVVKDGTAEGALAGFKIVVAGKTGTAELANTPNSPNDAWFIAFAPYRDIAVAVVVDRTYSYGADAAAPIARDVIQSLAASG